MKPSKIDGIPIPIEIKKIFGFNSIFWHFRLKETPYHSLRKKIKNPKDRWFRNAGLFSTQSIFEEEKKTSPKFDIKSFSI